MRIPRKKKKAQKVKFWKECMAKLDEILQDHKQNERNKKALTNKLIYF